MLLLLIGKILWMFQMQNNQMFLTFQMNLPNCRKLLFYQFYFRNLEPAMLPKLHLPYYISMNKVSYGGSKLLRSFLIETFSLNCGYFFLKINIYSFNKKYFDRLL